MLIDALRRQLQQEARTATGNNELRSKQFSRRITELMNQYTNQQLTAAEIIAELIRLSKEIVKESKRGEQFTPPLGNDELTFFDAVSTNESATGSWTTKFLLKLHASSFPCCAAMRRPTGQYAMTYVRNYDARSAGCYATTSIHRTRRQRPSSSCLNRWKNSRQGIQRRRANKVTLNTVVSPAADIAASGSSAAQCAR